MGQNDNEDEKFCSFWIMQLTTEYEIYEFLPTRPGVISKMGFSTLQYFTFALKSKANTKMLH